MSKFYMALLGTAFVLPSLAFASEEAVSNSGASSLVANLSRVALQYNRNSVTNKEEDAEYPGTFTSDEQEVFTGIFDGNLEYSNDSLIWLNSLFMEYGKSKAKENGVQTKSENADKILLTTDYTHKIWYLDPGVVGPFVNLGYQTEFTEFTADDGKKYRTKILRGKAGIKLYEGEYFKELYAAAVEEADYTYGSANMKTAGEVGYKFEYVIRDDMKFVSDGFLRKFFIYDKYRKTDFKYEAEMNNRLDVAIVGGLSFAPFVNYKVAKSRGASKRRSDTTVGLSLGYQTDYKFF